MVRKPTELEAQVLAALQAKGSYCPGAGGPRGHSERGYAVIDAMYSLVKKKYATIEHTDDGPRFHAS